MPQLSFSINVPVLHPWESPARMSKTHLFCITQYQSFCMTSKLVQCWDTQNMALQRVEDEAIAPQRDGTSKRGGRHKQQESVPHI